MTLYEEQIKIEEQVIRRILLHLYKSRLLLEELAFNRLNLEKAESSSFWEKDIESYINKLNSLNITSLAYKLEDSICELDSFENSKNESNQNSFMKLITEYRHNILTKSDSLQVGYKINKINIVSEIYKDYNASDANDQIDLTWI